MIICMSFTANNHGGSYTNTHHHFQTLAFDGKTLYVSTMGITPDTRTKVADRGEFNSSRRSVENTREDATYNETISIVQPYIVVYFWTRTK